MAAVFRLVTLLPPSVCISVHLQPSGKWRFFIYFFSFWSILLLEFVLFKNMQILLFTNLTLSQSLLKKQTLNILDRTYLIDSDIILYVTLKRMLQ